MVRTVVTVSCVLMVVRAPKETFAYYLPAK
jgi:hypothetical protein